MSPKRVPKGDLTTTIVGKVSRLFVGRGGSSSKRPSIPATPHRSTTQCPECYGLRANYGKMRVGALAGTALKGCDTCGIITSVLLAYCWDLEPTWQSPRLCAVSTRLSPCSLVSKGYWTHGQDFFCPGGLCSTGWVSMLLQLPR